MKAQCLMGASCAATCCDWLVARFHSLTVLSQPPVYTAVPSALNELHRMGPAWLVDALATAWPCGDTSQQYALLSQLVATRMLALGLKCRLEMPSCSGGVICTSLLGLSAAGFCCWNMVLLLGCHQR
jgi:hypothetical protein